MSRSRAPHPPTARRSTALRPRPDRRRSSRAPSPPRSRPRPKPPTKSSSAIGPARPRPSGAVAREHGLTHGAHERRWPDARSSSPRAARRRPPGAAQRRTRACSPSPQLLARADRRHHRRASTSTISGASHNTGQELDGDGPTGIPDIDIDGLQALRLERGDRDVVVAVIDDGVDFSHPDLADAEPGRTQAKPDGRRPTASTTTATATSTTSTAGTSATTTTRVPRRRARTSTGRTSPGRSRHRSTATASSVSRPAIKIMAVKFIDDSLDCGYGRHGDRRHRLRRLVRRADHQRLVGRTPTRVACSTPRSANRGALLVAAAGRQPRARHQHRRAGGPRFYPANFDATQRRDASPAIDQTGNWPRSRTTARRRSTSRRPGRTSCRRSPTLRAATRAGPGWRHLDGRAARVRRRGTRPQRHERHATPRALRARVQSTGAALASTAAKTVDRPARECPSGDRYRGSGRHAHQPPRVQRRHDRRLDRQHDDDLAGRDRRPQRRQELPHQAQPGWRRLDDADQRRPRRVPTSARCRSGRRPASSCTHGITPATSARAPPARPSRPRSSRTGRRSRSTRAPGRP